MRRLIEKSGFWILALCAVTVLTGCSQKPGLNIVREIPLPETYAQEVQSQPVQEAEPDDRSAEQKAAAESFASLDKVMKRAEDTGYAVTALFDFQKTMAPGMIDGFNVEIGDYSIPVLLFPSPEEAQTYADAINAAGYNIAVVNGRYLSMITASEGKAAYPEQQEAMEEILDAKAQLQSN
jgi:hypothetical protein